MTTTNTPIPSPGKDTGPLDWRMAIVDKAGRPTPEFQRKWNSQRFNNGLIGFVGTGDGPPADPPTGLGQVYVDITSTPNILYVGFDTVTWDQVGVVKFVQLQDVPNTYIDSGNFLVQVDVTEDALVFTSITDILDLVGSTQGDILYRDSGGWQVLPPGTVGQLLETGGSAANPSWVTPSAGNGTHFGTGAPSTLFTDGDLYFDRTAVPYQGYVQDPIGNPGGTVPTPRGSDLIASNGGPRTINFPAGSVAGDVAYLFSEDGWASNNPSGWTVLDNTFGSNTGGAVWQKTLTSGDISTGSVTVTYTGSFDGILAIIVFDGGTVTGTRSTTAHQSGSNLASDVVTTPAGVVPSDYLVLFGSNRANNTPTLSPGTSLHSASSGGGAASATIGDTTGQSGAVAITFLYPSGNSGVYSAVVVVEGGSGSPSPAWIAFT